MDRDPAAIVQHIMQPPGLAVRPWTGGDRPTGGDGGIAHTSRSGACYPAETLGRNANVTNEPQLDIGEVPLGPAQCMPPPVSQPFRAAPFPLGISSTPPNRWRTPPWMRRPSLSAAQPLCQLPHPLADCLHLGAMTAMDTPLHPSPSDLTYHWTPTRSTRACTEFIPKLLSRAIKGAVAL